MKRLGAPSAWFQYEASEKDAVKGASILRWLRTLSRGPNSARGSLALLYASLATDERQLLMVVDVLRTLSDHEIPLTPEQLSAAKAPSPAVFISTSLWQALLSATNGGRGGSSGKASGRASGKAPVGQSWAQLQRWLGAFRQLSKGALGSAVRGSPEGSTSSSRPGTSGTLPQGQLSGQLSGVQQQAMPLCARLLSTGEPPDGTVVLPVVCRVIEGAGAAAVGPRRVLREALRASEGLQPEARKHVFGCVLEETLASVQGVAVIGPDLAAFLAEALRSVCQPEHGLGVHQREHFVIQLLSAAEDGCEGSAAVRKGEAVMGLIGDALEAESATSTQPASRFPSSLAGAPLRFFPSRLCIPR